MGTPLFAQYDPFEVSIEGEKYQLSVGSYNGMNFMLFDKYHLT